MARGRFLLWSWSSSWDRDSRSRRIAVHPGGFLNGNGHFPDEAPHHPNHIGNIGSAVEKNRPLQGVIQAQGPKDDIDGNHRADGRNEPGRQQEQAKALPAPQGGTGQRVGSEYPRNI